MDKPKLILPKLILVVLTLQFMYKYLYEYNYSYELVNLVVPNWRCVLGITCHEYHGNFGQSVLH